MDFVFYSQWFFELSNLSKKLRLNATVGIRVLGRCAILGSKKADDESREGCEGCEGGTVRRYARLTEDGFGSGSSGLIRPKKFEKS